MSRPAYCVCSEASCVCTPRPHTEDVAASVASKFDYADLAVPMTYEAPKEMDVVFDKIPGYDPNEPPELVLGCLPSRVRKGPGQLSRADRNRLRRQEHELRVYLGGWARKARRLLLDSNTYSK